MAYLPVQKSYPFLLCNNQKNSKSGSFLYCRKFFPSHGKCNKHSQKSTFSKSFCQRHNETCNILNFDKANACFYHPTGRFLNISDNFITVSVKSLSCYFCKQFSQVESEKQEMDLCHFNLKKKKKTTNCKILLQPVMSPPLAFSLDDQCWLFFC